MEFETLKFKDALAPMLAGENVRVSHRNTKTAAFDLRSRTVILPLWTNMSPAVYDLLVGHEVGHALYTPAKGWHDALEPRGKVFKGYLNVIEDARIERLIKKRYPGLVQRFADGYQTLFRGHFFGVKPDQVDNLILIDRINVYCKVGPSSKVYFTPEERVFVDRALSTETWEEVETLVNDLFVYVGVKTKKVKAKSIDLGSLLKKLEEISGESSEQDNSEVESEVDDPAPEEDSKEPEDLPGDPEEKEFEGITEKQEEIKEDLVFEEEEDDDPEEEISSEAEPGGSADHEGLQEKEFNDIQELLDEFEIEAPNTEEAFSNNLKKYNAEVDSEVSIIEYKFKNYYDPSEYVVPNDKLVAAVKEAAGTRFDEEKQLALGNAYLKHIRPMVDAMSREFEMRKAAGVAARTSKKKTGVIDPVRMNRYKFDDDIFKKMTISPKGKNHGFIMYLDWSGSMTQEILPAIKQVITMAAFCKKIRVPFRVYAFSNCFKAVEEFPIERTAEDSDVVVPDPNLRLLELFNEKMTNPQMATMVSIMLPQFVYSGFKNNDVSQESWFKRNKLNKYDYCPTRFLGLSGTPLDSAMMVAPYIFEEFKSQNNVEIVNTVVIADGGSSSPHVWKKNKGEMVTTSASTTWSGEYVYVENIKGGKTLVRKWSDVIFDRYRAMTGSRMVCFYLNDNFDIINFQQRGWVEQEDRNYDEFIAVHSAVFKETSLDEEEQKYARKGQTMTKTILTNAARRVASTKQLRRGMLTRLAQMVS